MKRRAVLGLCMLCALAISAVAAQSAFAEKAYTCAPGGSTFSDALCTSAGSGFGHVELTKAETSITGQGAVTKLKSVQSGVTLELQSTELTGTGSMKNNAGGWAEGTGVITYKGVTVTAPAGKGCSVTGGQVVTNKLAATTEGLTKELKFTPASGETFAEFTVSGCSISALNHAYTAKGSVKGTTNGGKTEFTHAGTTAQGTLSLSGQKAGIEGTLEIKGENGNALVLT
jgi:hypothetical protein